MPVWLDAIPEKAVKVPRPHTRRWLLFLAFVMLAGIALTLWNWRSERTGFVFWFSALGLPFCCWGLIFSLRRFAYKAEQVGAESRNVERELLIQREILRGQRCAWILGTYVHSSAGNKPGALLDAMAKSVPVMERSTPRGCIAPVRYAALTAFQGNLSEELKTTVTKLSTRIQSIVEPLPEGLPCWLMLDCEGDLYDRVEKQLKDALYLRTGRVFRLIAGKGLAALDTWLDKRWESPGILVTVTLALPAIPREDDADAITMMVLSNRKATGFPDAVRLHRPEKGTHDSLTKTLDRALLWATSQPENLRGSWFTGTILTQGSDWNNACEENRVIFSLSEENSSIDSVLGYAGHASPWLAIALASEVVEVRGPQVIAAQPDADKDEIWVGVITPNKVSKGSTDNV